MNFLTDYLAEGQMQEVEQDPRAHLHAMIALADRLICESLNETDPAEPPERTVSKEEFLSRYMAHSNALCGILDNMRADDMPNVDEELAAARSELATAVQHLQVKLDKLDNLRFWMDNMIFDQSDQ